MYDPNGLFPSGLALFNSKPISKVEYISARCTHRHETLLVHYNIPNMKLYRILAMKIGKMLTIFLKIGERVTV